MKSQDLKDGENQGDMESKLKPADMIWVKNRGGSWWPAQVVDENLISESRKPSKRSAGKVLVRLYGSYTYCYVDPIKWHSEFDTILEQNNGSYGDILLKALEQDVSRLKTKTQRLKSKGTKENESRKYDDLEKKKNLKRNGASSAMEDEKSSEDADGNLTPKQNEVLKKRKLNSSSPESCTKSQELSARRLRVMQSLGLAAPPGSPFGKNGHAYLTE